ncbi:MAG TPA: nucleotidyltransferase domain-containing protein [Candidatus Cloacimonadota bacterium]|nr:nucleotidyltransferase domain-containing protein [Candidatus Cloacimonadota bacterium]
MKAYGIYQETWDQILSVLRSESKVREIILFGSRAKGVFKEGSDIDICIKGKDLGYDDLIRLNGLLDELDLPWEIGLLIHDMIDEPMLIEHIARVGIKL